MAEIEQTVYADVLFLVNFAMDLITLFIVGRIMHRRRRPWATIAAAALGAFYGVAAVFLPGNTVVAIAVNIAVSLVLCRIAFNGRTMACAALFYAVGLMLGGAVSAVGRLSGRLFGGISSGSAAGGELPAGYIIIIAAVFGAVALGGMRLRRLPSEGRITAEGPQGSISFTGMYDSGNLAVEPFSGMPVIITSYEILAPLLSQPLRPAFADCSPELLAALTPEEARRVRLIPAFSAGTESRLLLGYIPLRLTVDGQERDALLAVDGSHPAEPDSAYGGSGALIPASLIAV